MLQDFRFAFRVLASRPGFTLVAALSLTRARRHGREIQMSADDRR
jgi:hypothetical protein